MLAEIRPYWQVLTQQAIGVVVAPPLPWALRLAEIEIEPSVVIFNDFRLQRRARRRRLKGTSWPILLVSRTVVGRGAVYIAKMDLSGSVGKVTAWPRDSYPSKNMLPSLPAA